MPVATMSASELASTLRPVLLRVTRLIRSQRVDQSVTLTQLSAMATLHKYGSMSAGELANAEKVQPPSMTKVLANLVERGLVVREPHPTDGRQVVLEVSDAGRELLDDERRSRNAWLSERLATLEPEERALLERVAPVLDKLADQ